MLVWTLMVIAMMWPIWARTANRTWSVTFRRWRPAALGAFLGTVTVLWIVAGAASKVAVGWPTGALPGWTWTSLCFVAAAALMFSIRRRRLLRRCEPLPVLAPGGRRALFTAARLGWASWTRCAILCGPVMLAMLGPHQLLLMLGGSAAVWWEQRYPRRWQDPVPVQILAGAAIVACLLGVMDGFPAR